MLMPKKNRIAIYELLFKEGVMVAKKDVHLAKHPELADKNVPNLHVMKAMQVGNESSKTLQIFLKLLYNVSENSQFWTVKWWHWVGVGPNTLLLLHQQGVFDGETTN